MRKQLLYIFIFISISLSAHSQNTLQGTIVTNDGKLAVSVNIELDHYPAKTKSNKEGRFIIPGIADGNYLITVSFDGLVTQQKRVVLSAGDTTTLDFILHESARELMEVIIMARGGLNARPLTIGKIAVDPMDNPQSIAVIEQSVIRDQQSQRLSEVIKNVNGVYLATTRGSTQESFSARGYSFSSNNLFKNGSRINTGTMPEMNSLEKVEVLKGSAAILYGNVAPGGIINMVTKQPKFNKGGEISLRAGSYGLFKPSFDYYGPLSTKTAFRINGTYEKSRSYRDEVRSERFYINPSVLIKLNSQTEILFQGDYLDHSFTPDFGTGSLDNTIIANVPRSAFMGTPWQYNKARQATATATLKHKFAYTWNINFTTSWQQFNRDYYSTERIQASANGDWRRPLNKLQSRENYFLTQADLTGKFNTGKVGHTLLAGIDADHYYTTSFTFNNPAFYDTVNILDPLKFTPRTDIPSAIKITRTQTPVLRFGAYLQDLISLSEKLKLLAGVRWSLQQNEPIISNYLLKDSISKIQSRTDKAFSPKAGIVYRPLVNMSLFGSYSQSFIPNNNPNGNSLSPSIIDQYEAGIKNEFFKGKLQANLTVYRIINNNLAMVALLNADGTPNTNPNFKELTGQTTSDGFEADISSHPVTGLNILAGYSYNNMRYTKTKEGKGNYIEGERLVNTPAHTGNISLFYTVQKGNGKGLKVGASAFYTGSRFGGWNNTQQQAQAYSRLIPVKGFITADISAGYTLKKFSLVAKVSNVFNTYNYYVHENYSINPIQPRMLIATISYKL